MTLPGPNLTGVSDRRPRSLPTERLFEQRPTRTLAQAMAMGLQLDPVAREAGYADGAAGKGWDPGKLEVLAYASGYLDGRRFGRNQGG